MRLFIAINLNNGTKESLLALRDELRSRSKRGNFCFPENLHLTLAFLGECNDIEAASAKTVMNSMSFIPFSVIIDHVGQFKRYGGDIWWAGIHNNKPLLDLQYTLTEKLISAGFGLDKRKYTPHVTLGRDVETNEAPWEIKPFGETVPSIELMKSEKINGKLTYTALYFKSAAT